MRIKANTWTEIGRMFSCLEYAERISHDCASQQANMKSVDCNRFFVRQARQELYHAKVFNRVVLCVTPRGPKQVPPSLREFRTRVDRACQRGDLVESLVSQQIVLEALGGLILCKMDKKFDQRRIGFRRIRKTLLHQEQGHQAFGHRTLHNLLESDKVKLERVYELTSEYLALAEFILDELQPVFDVIGADVKWYQRALHERLVDWVEV